MRQNNLNITLIEKFNLKLIRISEYFQRFRLDIRYRKDKFNIILNILSRLSIINEYRTIVDKIINIYKNQKITENTVKQISAYLIILIELNDDFK